MLTDRAPILVAVTEEEAATAIDTCGGEGRKETLNLTLATKCFQFLNFYQPIYITLSVIIKIFCI